MAGAVSELANLNGYISLDNMACLNADNDTSMKSIFESDHGLLRSDADEQLLMLIPFTEKVKIKSLAFRSHPRDGESSPAIVKLFVNQPNLDFSDCEDATPSQVLKLGEEDTKGTPIPLKFVKFQKVQTLTVFIESNQDDEDVTSLSNLTIIGCPIAGTNMKELKKMG